MTVLRPRPILLLVVGVLGLTIAVSYNTFAAARSVQSERGSGLIEVIGVMELERSGLEEGLNVLRGQVALLEEEAAEEAGLAESFGKELADVRRAAGLTWVRGPGVAVDLADAEKVPPDQDPSSCLIHDFDIATVVSTLFAAGAEAVAVNDERVVATTAVRCAGSTILVNSKRLGNPYRVVAIGDPEGLEHALREDAATAALFDSYPAFYGLETGISQFDDIEIPAYRGSLRTDHAVSTAGGD